MSQERPDDPKISRWMEELKKDMEGGSNYMERFKNSLKRAEQEQKENQYPYSPEQIMMASEIVGHFSREGMIDPKADPNEISLILRGIGLDAQERQSKRQKPENPG